MAIWPTDCFRDKVLVVTGATSGIGAAIALGFQSEGARVVVTGATEAEVARARDEMPGIDARLLDVRDGEAVSALFAGLPRLDHLVNCAGIIRRGDESRPDVFADVVDINLTGTMRTCTAARTLLAQSRGTIVNTASMLSFFGGGLVPGYSASKGGVAQLTKSLAIAFAKEGIRVNAIAPGWIDTPLTRALQQDENRARAILSRTPMERWGKPEELTGGVAYLSSPLSSFVTGAVLVIDGGYLIT